MRALAFTLLLVSCASDEVAVPSTKAEPQVARPDPWDTPSIVNLPNATQAQPMPALPLSFAFSPPTQTIVEPSPRGSSLVTSMPSGHAKVIAVTDDGRAAVSADGGLTARLWPTLDGKREPVVVMMRTPAALALARNAEGFAIAGLDAAGQLEIVVTKASGQSEKRIAIEHARPFVSVHATSAGFLALTDERAIVLVGFDGVASAPLVAEPEEHVASVVVRGKHALALVESGGKVRGRRIEIGERFVWGEATAELPLAPDVVAMTPDGTRVAGLTNKGKRIAIVELASGKVLSRVFDRDQRDEQVRPLGFLDDRQLAFTAASQQLAVWNGEVWYEPHGMDGTVVAVANGRAVMGANGSLMLVRRGETQFVGYRMSGPVHLRPVGKRFLATDSTQVVELDEHLRTRQAYELPLPLGWQNRGWHDVKPIDDRHVVASTYTGAGYAIYLLDLVDAEAALVAEKGYQMDFEPATGMLAYRAEKSIEIVQYDAKAGTFSAPAIIAATPTNPPHFQLLDPKIADGHVGGLVTTNQTQADVKLFKAFHFGNADQPFELAKEETVTLDERFWRRVGDIRFLIDRKWHSTERSRSPNGKHVAELRDLRIILRDARGKQLWTIPSYGAQRVTWTPAGRLIAYGSGIAELDVESGAIVERQCGWRFGVWNVPTDAFDSAGLCEAP